MAGFVIKATDYATPPYRTVKNDILILTGEMPAAEERSRTPAKMQNEYEEGDAGMKKRIIAILLTAVMLLSVLSLPAMAEDQKWTEEKTKDGWIKVTQEGGKTLGYSETSGVKILTVDGFAFKDLNKNGELDPYEDWRLSAQERAADLAAKISIDQISGLRFENGLVLMDPDDARDIIEGDLCTNFYANNLTSSDAKISAGYVNDVQEIAESQPWGIPVQFMVDPRPYFNSGLNQLSMGATFDPELVQEVSVQAAKIYRALGIVLLFGPQADTSTEPRWKRIDGTYGEDPQLVADLAKAAVTGLQSTYAEDGTDLGWGEDTVVSEIKHYPGDAPGEGGRESHEFYGKFNVYPGDNFDAHLVGFNDGAFNLDSETDAAGAVMMSYSIAWSEDGKYGDLVGSAFSAYKIGLLRDNGFDGVISTDALIDGENNIGVGESIHGMEGYSYAEQIYEIIAVGNDRILTPNFAKTPMGGTGMSPENISIPQYIRMAYDTMVEKLGQEAADENYRSSATRILTNYFRAGIFENAYVDEKAAASIIKEAQENIVNAYTLKSIVMLKNSGVIAESAEKPTVYVPMVGTTTGEGEEAKTTYALPLDAVELKKYFNVVTDTATADGVTRATAEELAGCTMAAVFISSPATGTGVTDVDKDAKTATYIPVSLQYGEYVADGENVRKQSISLYGNTVEKTEENRSYYGKSTVAENIADMQLVLDTKAALPEGVKLVVCVTANRGMIFSEIEPSADAILVSFGVDATNFLPVIAGQSEPAGLLPLQMPANMDTVEAQYEDVPRDMECYVDADGNVYDFAYGLNWSGKIEDARVEKYSAAPLTKPVNYDLSNKK